MTVSPRPPRGRAQPASNRFPPAEVLDGRIQVFTDGASLRRHLVTIGTIVPVDVVRARPPFRWWHAEPPTLRLLGSEKPWSDEDREELMLEPRERWRPSWRFAGGDA